MKKLHNILFIICCGFMNSVQAQNATYEDVSQASEKITNASTTPSTKVEATQSVQVVDPISERMEKLIAQRQSFKQKKITQFSPSNFKKFLRNMSAVEKYYAKYLKSKRRDKLSKKMRTYIEKAEKSAYDIEAIVSLNQSFFDYSLSQIRLIDQIVIPEFQSKYEREKSKLVRLFKSVERKRATNSFVKQRESMRKSFDVLEKSILTRRLVTPKRIESSNLDRRLIPINHRKVYDAIAKLEDLLQRTPKEVEMIEKTKSEAEFALKRAKSRQKEALSAQSIARKNIEKVIDEYHASLDNLAAKIQVAAHSDQSFVARIRLIGEHIEERLRQENSETETSPEEELY